MSVCHELKVEAKENVENMAKVYYVRIIIHDF